MSHCAPPLETILACPRCHGRLERDREGLACASRTCGARAPVRDGIVSALTGSAEPSFFDERFPVMMHGTEETGSHRAFYAEQVLVLRRALADARVIVDVGCGPKLRYERPPGSVLVGVDLSLASLRHNADADVRVHGSATALPLPAGSVDAIVCLYSVHHLVGGSVGETEALVGAALAEFARVLRPGGQLLVFDVAPWWPGAALQRRAWNLLRRGLGRSLDMFFWETSALESLAGERFPVGTRFERRVFRSSPWLTFPPIFSIPWFRLPRCLYPFRICLYQWRRAPATDSAAPVPVRSRDRVPRPESLSTVRETP